MWQARGRGRGGRGGRGGQGRGPTAAQGWGSGGGDGERVSHAQKVDEKMPDFGNFQKGGRQKVCARPVAMSSVVSGCEPSDAQGREIMLGLHRAYDANRIQLSDAEQADEFRIILAMRSHVTSHVIEIENSPPGMQLWRVFLVMMRVIRRSSSVKPLFEALEKMIFWHAMQYRLDQFHEQGGWARGDVSAPL